MRLKKLKYDWKSIILIYAIISVLRFLYVYSGWTDLDAEETQYWLWSKHLDFSYYSKPPLIAYINAFSTSIFGDFPWVIRLNAIILGALVALATYYVVLKIYSSKKLAFYISLCLLILPSYHYISLFFTTDVLVTLFWLLTCYFFWMSFQTNKLKFWILTGISMGIGIISKYALLFFIPFSFIYTLIKKRKLLLHYGFYVYIIIALIIFSPVIYWNIQHKMVGVFHVTTLAGIGNQIIQWENLLSRQAELLGGQLLLNLPLLFILFYWDKYHIKKLLKGEFEKYIIATNVFIYIIFSLVTLMRRVYINWLLFSYIPLYIVLLSAIFRSGLIQEKIAKKYIAVTCFLMVLLISQPILAIHAKQFSKLLPASIDPFRNIVEWNTFTNFVYSEIEKHIEDDKFEVFSNRYQIASEFSFYGPNHPTTYCYPYKKRRMNQYDIWGIPYEKIKHKKAVFVNNEPFDEEMLQWIGEENIIYQTTYSVYYKSTNVRTYYMYILNYMPKFKNSENVIFKF